MELKNLIENLDVIKEFIPIVNKKLESESRASSSIESEEGYVEDFFNRIMSATSDANILSSYTMEQVKSIYFAMYIGRVCKDDEITNISMDEFKKLASNEIMVSDIFGEKEDYEFTILSKTPCGVYLQRFVDIVENGLDGGNVNDSTLNISDNLSCDCCAEKIENHKGILVWNEVMDGSDIVITNFKVGHYGVCNHAWSDVFKGEMTAILSSLATDKDALKRFMEHIKDKALTGEAKKELSNIITSLKR